MAAKKPGKTKKAAKAVAKAPRAPIELDKNWAGKSESFDAALEASTTLLCHYYHATLAKYVDSKGAIVDKIVFPGQGADAEPVTVPGVVALRLDLDNVQELAIRINNLQRIRSDHAIDVRLNPLNVSQG